MGKLLIGILKWLGLIKEPVIQETFEISWYQGHKPYSEMTPKEKRKYRRWLDKNGYWDSQVMIYHNLGARKIKD